MRITNIKNYFFVTGKKDHAVCFHCGVGLKDWKNTDSVMREHAKWSPDCLYVLHIKGRVFVLKNGSS
jgi:hypothetical protein